MPNTEIQNMDVILYRVRRIKDLIFFVNETLFKADREAKVDFNNNLAYNLDSNMLFFTLRITFHYPDDEAKNLLLEAHIQNIFEVTDLKKFMQADRLVLPNNFLISMVSLSVSHSRALVAKNCAGTAYQETLIPIINAETMTKVFFPDAFNTPKMEDNIEDEIIEKKATKKSTVTIGKNKPSKNTY